MTRRTIKLLDDVLLNISLIRKKHSYNDRGFVTTLDDGTELALKFENAEKHLIVIDDAKSISDEDVKALIDQIEDIKDLLPRMTVRQVIEKFEEIVRDRFNNL